MFLTPPQRAIMRQVLTRLLLVWLMCCILAGATLSAWAQSPGGVTPTNPTTPPAAGGGGLVWKICDPPPVCFESKAAKEAWAKKENCRFIEEVCEKTTPEQDKKGARDEDKGFWGELWDKVKGSLTYGYEFVKGLYAGLKEQIADLVHLFTNASEVIEGLVQLGKAFFDDPKGTLASLGELLGQEAIDAITKATQCGAYDLGKVVATYVNPYFTVKLAQRLTKYGGKLADASKALRHEYGCSSFAAGTLVFTANGMVQIEQINVGQQVLSRNERSYADRQQSVTNTFTRQASSYQLLTTEGGSYRVTGEHTLWLQGKGWTPADQIQAGDVLAGERLDSLIIANQAVAAPLRVYNFSVGLTPSYFVGSSGIWVHNGSKCSTDIYSKNWKHLTAPEIGFRGEVMVLEDLISEKYQPVAGSHDHRGKPPTVAFAEREGQHALDGVLKTPEGKYVLIETKSTGGTSKSNPDGCVVKLCIVEKPDKTGKDRQMSTDYILARLKNSITDPVALEEIAYGLKENDGSVIRVYAQVDERGILYHVINETAEDGVKIGKKWTP